MRKRTNIAKAGPRAQRQPSSPPDPFGPLPDWHNNACINNHMQFEELAGCFRRSADALVQRAVDERGTLDVHVYAICFLYRHSFELTLKDLFWQCGYALNGDKAFGLHHGLRSLWGEVEKRTRKLLGKDFPITPKEAAAVKQLFVDIEEHDPGSDSFRYPIDSKKRRAHPSLTNVNIRALREQSDQAAACLLRIGSLVDYHYSQRSEMERENGT